MARQPLSGQTLPLTVKDSRSHSRHTTFGRTPLDKWSARRRDLYLTTHNTHKRQTFIPTARFETAIPTSERPHTDALDRTATGIGSTCEYFHLYSTFSAQHMAINHRVRDMYICSPLKDYQCDMLIAWRYRHIRRHTFIHRRNAHGFSFSAFTYEFPIPEIQKEKRNIQGDTKKTGTFEKPNKNWRNPREKFINRNWTITTCPLRDSNPNYQCLKITFVDGVVLLHVCIPSLPLRISKVPVLLCHPVCVACSAHRVTQKTGTFEMRSDSERMHTWRRTPSTGRNFQTLIIWITVS